MGARLGQHFLRDEGVRDAIASLSGAGPGTRVLEIGPGRGAITGRLLATGAELVAVELDENLAAKLPANVGGDVSRLTIVNDDFLRLDLRELGPGPLRIVANLPYAVGTPILQRILEWDNWDRAVLMFQKEVADRITAAPGGADYGLLALSVLARADARAAFDVAREAFMPPPDVESAVVALTRLEKPRLEPADEKAFWRLAKLAFAQRRKMAAGVLAKALGKAKSDVEAAFAAAGLAPGVRPERIPFEAWRALARSLR